MYTFRIFDSITAECKKIWKDDRNKFSSTFFQDIQYVEEVIKNKNNQIKIVIIYYNNIALAILPFEIKRYFFVNVLQWIGTDYSDYCNPILSERYKTLFNKIYFLNVWKLILDEMKKDIDLVFFNNQLALINNITNPFVSNFKTSLFSKIYNITLGEKFKDYKDNIKNKDKSHAYEIHRTLIKYEKLKKISKNLTVNIESSDHNLLDFKSIIDEKKKQLFKKNINNKLDEDFKKIFQNLIDSKKIKFYLISLMVGKNALSRCFGFVYANTFYYYIPTVLPNSFNNYKPGKILIIQLIEWCIKNNIKKFDFGLGSEKYKKYFSNKEISLHRYIYSCSFKGSVAHILLFILLKIKKLWL